MIHIDRSDFEKEFDEAKHPRDGHGRFSPSPSTAPSASPGSRTLPATMREANGRPHNVDIERFGEGDSVGTVYQARFGDGTKAVYKPDSGNGYKIMAFDGKDKMREVSLRKDMDESVLPSNKEVAVSELDRTLGFGRVPHTEVVDYGKGRGYAQAWVEGEVARNVQYDTVTNQVLAGKSMQQLAALDVIAGNTDRHFGNFILGRDNDEWFGIDHGLTFPDKDTQFRSVPVKTLGGSSIPIHADVAKAVAALSPEKLDVILTRNGIGRKARAQAQQRLTLLKNAADWREVAIAFRGGI